MMEQGDDHDDGYYHNEDQGLQFGKKKEKNKIGSR
jgi:hypothetical protein